MIAKVLQIPANRVQIKTKRLGTCNQIPFYTCGSDRKYRVLVSVCLSVCLCVCVCVCV